MANHNLAITNNLPTWVFIQSTASGNYRHEIQRVPSDRFSSAVRSGSVRGPFGFRLRYIIVF